MSHYLTIFSCLLLLPFTSYAQKDYQDKHLAPSNTITTNEVQPVVPLRIPQTITFKHLGEREGIPAYVGNLVKDKKGFLWMGTNEGVLRFDGIETQLYQQHPLDKEGLSNNRKLLVNLGNVANWRNQYDRAIAYYEAGMEKIAAERDQMFVLYNMSALQSRIGGMEAIVVENYTKLKEYTQKNEMTRLESAVTTSIGEVYTELKEYDKAIVYHKEALDLLEQIGNEWNKPPILLSIADIYYETDPPKGIAEYKRLLEDSHGIFFHGR